MLRKCCTKYVEISLAVSCLIAFGNVAYAEENQEFFMEEFIVTASRTPVEEFKANANVSVVSRKMLERNHYTNVQDALRNIPGVTISGYGNTGEVYSANSLILNGSDKVVVLIDGVRANINGSSMTYGKMATSELSNMDSIERIEVLKSSSSTLYGADAAGGVINIITRKPLENKTKTKLSAVKGSFGREQYNLNHQGGSKGFYWQISGQKKLAGYFKDGWNRTIPEQLNSENNVFKIGKNFGENADISVTYQTYKTKYLRPTGGWDTVGGNIAANKFNTGEKDNSKLTMLYKQKLSEKVTNHFAFFNNKHRADEITWNKALTVSQPYIFYYSSMGFSNQITIKPDNKHTLVGGIEWYRDKVDRYRTSALSQYSDKETVNKAIFLHDEFAPDDKWNISYGCRYNHDSNYGHKLIPSLVIGHSPSNRINYYIGYKKFFVAPYPSQLYGQNGDPNLKPESGSAFEGGINYRFKEDFLGSMHIFRRDMKDSIGYNSGTKKYENSGEENAMGFDVQLRKAFSENFTGNMGYTYTYIKPGDSKRNPNNDGRIPRSAWNMSLNYDVEKFNAEITARGVIGKQGSKGKTYGDNTSEEAKPYHTYWIFDIGLNYKANKDINIFAKCNNIFNRLYTEQRACLLPETGKSWYSAPGRNYFVGVEYSF